MPGNAPYSSCPLPSIDKCIRILRLAAQARHPEDGLRRENWRLGRSRDCQRMTKHYHNHGYSHFMTKGRQTGVYGFTVITYMLRATYIELRALRRIQKTGQGTE